MAWAFRLHMIDPRCHDDLHNMHRGQHALDDTCANLKLMSNQLFLMCMNIFLRLKDSQKKLVSIVAPGMKVQGAELETIAHSKKLYIFDPKEFQEPQRCH